MLLMPPWSPRAAYAVVMTMLIVCSHTGFAQNYPAKPVRVVIPWPAGGLTDVAGRIAFQKNSENTGQLVIVDTRGGANGLIGADVVAKSPPEGYPLMVHSTSHVSIPRVYKTLPYDPL